MNQTSPTLFIKTLLLILCAAILLLVATPQQSAAESFAPLTVTVNYTGNDLGDANPGNGVCATSLGNCTMRAAIEEVNAYNISSPGTHKINFNGAGTPLTILPGSPLPAITAPVTINGTTQPGSSCPSGVNTPATLNVVLNGAAAGSNAKGLTFASGSDGSLVKGLVIGNFDDYGIYFNQFVGNITVQCNHIGINRNGETAFPNRWGISGFGSNDNIIVGGTSYSPRNVISGNTVIGVKASGDDSSIKGNFIGTNASGTTAVPNSLGVRLEGGNNIVGGALPCERNIISGNSKSGIDIFYSANNGEIVNNYIGTNVFGGPEIGNAEHGITFDKGIVGGIVPHGHQIGIVAGQGNRIAYNGLAGINLEGDTSLPAFPNNNTIRYNAIYENGGLGIDLSLNLNGDGVTANDGYPDPDSGPNTLLNFPSLSNVFTDGTNVTLTIDYLGQAGFYDADIYINDSCDPSGYGEGESFIYTHAFGTTGAYNDTISFTAGSAAGRYLTSMVTYGNNSSEFSECIPIADLTTLLINDSGNAGDVNIGNGSCDSDAGTSGDQCTLRAAIQEVNAAGSGVGPITVNFDIPGGGLHVIQPSSSPLPAITHPILLDATTQPGASCPTANDYANILVRLDGAGIGGTVNGLTLNSGSDGSLIKGFSITRFGGDGIEINSDDNVAQCNYIGVDIDGYSVGANGGEGIDISGDDNLIGGSFDTLRNIISGNIASGVTLNSAAERNDIFGNIIGLNNKVSEKVGNGFSGIFIGGGDRNNIGGNNDDLGNYIGGNNSMGIYLYLNSNYNDIYNNKIGVDKDNKPGLGNGSHGIWGILASYNRVGASTGGGVGNVIADNDGYGIIFTDDSVGNWIRFNTVFEHTFAGISIVKGDDHLITHNEITDNGTAGIGISGASSTGNEISENSVYANGGLGIDLEADGSVEVNDSLDADSGPNGLQNFPFLNLTTGGTTIEGELFSTANKDFTLEFFSNVTCDSSGNGEGKTYLGKKDVTTDGSGHVDFSAVMVSSFVNGDMITAVATEKLSRNSSEFSPCLTVCDNSNPLLPAIDIVSNSVELDWNSDPTALNYIIFRSINQPYNVTSFYASVVPPTSLWVDGDSDEIGDVANNHYYTIAVDRICGISVASKTVGEFDFGIVPGTP